MVKIIFNIQLAAHPEGEMAGYARSPPIKPETRSESIPKPDICSLSPHLCLGYYDKIKGVRAFEV